MREKPPRTLHVDVQARGKLRQFRGTMDDHINDEIVEMPEPWSKTITWMAEALEALGIDHRIPLADVKEIVRARLLKPRVSGGAE